MADHCVLIPPADHGLRGWDPYGSGAFGASRGDRRHRGLDFVVEPGEVVRSPITGRVIRHGLAYADGNYKLIVIENDDLEVRVLYLQPTAEKGSHIEAGQPIGIAQDLRQRYPADEHHAAAITPHVHLEARVLLGGALVGRGHAPDTPIWLNPALLMGTS